MNIVIFSESGKSKISELLELDDEVELREFSADELENYKQYNPSLLILDLDLTKIREFCAVRKLECSVLRRNRMNLSFIFNRRERWKNPQ